MDGTPKPSPNMLQVGFTPQAGNLKAGGSITPPQTPT